jgi:oxidase EvaA
LQSEQGARFLRKRNRNIIIKIDDEIIIHEDFIWLTLGQIKKLITFDNIVNMDTRTVISGIPFDSVEYSEEILSHYALGKSIDFKLLNSAVSEVNALNEFDDILNWLTSLKCKYELELRHISLFHINDWKIGKYDISHIDNKYFQVIAAEVSISNREVQKWSQPLVKPLQHGITGFIMKEINGINHFLVQAKLECGNFDILEMAPTVQCITDSYLNPKDVPFLDFLLDIEKENIIYDTLQSEEGGRFFREQNRNLIVRVDSDFPLEVPENYFWINLKQLNMFLKFNNYLNIQSRSIISAINFLKL